MSNDHYLADYYKLINEEMDIVVDMIITLGRFDKRFYPPNERGDAYVFWEFTKMWSLNVRIKNATRQKD